MFHRFWWNGNSNFSHFFLSSNVLIWTGLYYAEGSQWIWDKEWDLLCYLYCRSCCLSSHTWLCLCSCVMCNLLPLYIILLGVSMQQPGWTWLKYRGHPSPRAKGRGNTCNRSSLYLCMLGVILLLGSLGCSVTSFSHITLLSSVFRSWCKNQCEDWLLVLLEVTFVCFSGRRRGVNENSYWLNELLKSIYTCLLLEFTLETFLWREVQLWIWKRESQGGLKKYIFMYHQV